jgi:cation:H+ antiporter
MLTPWEPRVEVLTGVLITLAAAAWLRFNARRSGVVLWALLGNGVLYGAYLGLTLGR